MGQSRNSKMRNSVKMFALILIMSVFLRGIEGARIYAIGPADVKTDRPIAGGNNVTQPTGLVGTGAITIGGGLGARTCPLLYNCPSGDLCCYRYKNGDCLYNDCQPLSSFY